jgi:DNA-binding response OmpR family regulator
MGISRNRLLNHMSNKAMVSSETTRARQMMSQSSCILLIEDDPLVSRRLEVLIEAAGFSVVPVATMALGRQALEAVIFPIVIVDRMLEDGDGIGMCQQIRELSEPNRVYTMLLSARDSAQDIAEGIAAGADDYLSKNSSDEELIARLHAAIRLVRLQSR